MAEILGYLIGGIGVFFVGVHTISSGLKQMTGRRLRILVPRWTGNAFQAGAIGLLSGFITQSMSAVSFITASLVASGLTTVRRSIPLIFWANVGCGVLVLLAFLNIKVLVLFLLGIAGISIAFEKPARFRTLAETVFGVGLLFYGLHMTKTGAAPLAEMEWFSAFLLNARHSYALGFVIGALLTMASQSSSAVAILTIAMTQAGLFSIDQTIMIIYGANLGSSSITWFLSLNLTGKPKQLVMTQVLFNCAAVLILVPLFYLEVYGHIPLVKAFVVSLSSRVEQQMAYVFLLLNIGAAIVLSSLIAPFARLCSRLWPPTQEESWSQLRYLHDQALQEPESALVLVDREITGVIERLPLYMKALRSAAQDRSHPTFETLNTALKSVLREIEAYASEIFSKVRSHDTSEYLINIQNRHNALGAINESVYELSCLLVTLSETDSKRLREIFLEGLETILLTLRDVAVSQDRMDVDMLIVMTHDRSDLMQNMRLTFTTNMGEADLSGRMAFIQVTSLFEGIVRNIHRMTLLYRDSSSLGKYMT